MTETNSAPPTGSAAASSGTQDLAAVLTRTIAIANDKGGVGKTSLTANLSALYATAGYKVLIVDLNRQANLADDLGYRGSPIDDQGVAFITALQHGQALKPQSVPGRSGLDVIVGGESLTSLTAIVLSNLSTQGVDAYLALARALAPAAEPYDLILIDTPPENTTLVDLALRAARWLLIPTKSDKGGVGGMRLLAGRFTAARQTNPALGLLGVVLFATGRNSTAIHRSVRQAVEQEFGAGNSPMLTTFIGAAEKLAKDARDAGRVIHELESDAAKQPAWWESLRAGERVNRIPPTATNVAEDYRKLAAEVLDILAAAEGVPAQ
jgi:chromosome partitioning protein